MVAQGLEKRRAIIIDDEPAFSRVLSKMVADLGFEAVLASDPRSNYAYLVGDSDIIFLDMLMPHLSGIAVLEELSRRNVKSSIVLISGEGEKLNEAEKLAKQLDLTIVGVLEKPFRFQDVKDIIENF